jgi:hypothetical protein
MAFLVSAISPQPPCGVPSSASTSWKRELHAFELAPVSCTVSAPCSSAAERQSICRGSAAAMLKTYPAGLTATPGGRRRRAGGRRYGVAPPLTWGFEPLPCSPRRYPGRDRVRKPFAPLSERGIHTERSSHEP